MYVVRVCTASCKAVSSGSLGLFTGVGTQITVMSRSPTAAKSVVALTRPLSTRYAVHPVLVYVQARYHEPARGRGNYSGEPHVAQSHHSYFGGALRDLFGETSRSITLRRQPCPLSPWSGPGCGPSDHWQSL